MFLCGFYMLQREGATFYDKLIWTEAVRILYNVCDPLLHRFGNVVDVSKSNSTRLYEVTYALVSCHLERRAHNIRIPDYTYSG